MPRPPVGGRARVRGDDAVVREPRGELVEQQLGVDRVRREVRAVVQDLPPARHLVLDLLAPGAILLALKLRDQGRERLLRVAHEEDVHRVAHSHEPPVDVDLHAARLALLRQPLGVGEARADHQQRVAVLHHVIARLGAEEADRAGHERQVVGQGRLAVERLGHAAAEQVGHLGHLVLRAERPGADQHRDLLAGVEQLGGGVEVGRLWHHVGLLEAHRGEH